MSNSIRDMENLHSRQLQTAERRHKRDLRNIDNSYQDLKADLKKTQGQELVDIQQEHLRTIENEQAKKEKVLAEMRGHLDQTSRMTEKELSSLKKNVEAEKGKIATNLATDRERQITMHQLYLEDENDRFNTAIRDVNSEGNSRLSDMKLRMNEEIQEMDGRHQNKLRDKQDEFVKSYRSTEAQNERIKTNQEEQFKRDRLKANLTQQRELTKLTDEHTHHLSNENENFRKAYRNQDLFFEKRYEEQLKGHEETFQKLKAKNDTLLNSLKENLSSSIALVSQKNGDPFYKFETLSPKLKHFDDHVEISVEVPEYSKKDVQISFNGKEAILTMNRRYQDAARTENGTINKVSKVESFSTRIPTESVLNAKSVKSSYEDGVLTFSVKKA